MHKKARSSFLKLLPPRKKLSSKSILVDGDRCVKQPILGPYIKLQPGAGGLGFESRASQIDPRIAHGSPLLRRFFGAVLPRRQAAKMDSVTRYGVKPRV